MLINYYPPLMSVSHISPTIYGGQIQLKEAPFSSHVPPFMQGLLSQGDKEPAGVGVFPAEK